MAAGEESDHHTATPSKQVLTSAPQQRDPAKGFHTLTAKGVQKHHEESYVSGQIPVRASSFQAVPQVVHPIQELAAWQGVISQLPEVFWPQVLPSVSCHGVITCKPTTQGISTHRSLIPLAPQDLTAGWHNEQEGIFHSGNTANHKQLMYLIRLAHQARYFEK